ncbi:MAG: DUF177 domain-containing protein [Bacteroidales bacterium]|nr:DUF177 domain-containing protein [Bacteroidales bacterium]
MEDKQYFKQFDIEFVKLPLGVSGLTLEVDKRFFGKHTNDEISDANVTVQLQIEKKERFMRFGFHLTGNVTVTCDICLEKLLCPVEVTETYTLRKAEKEEPPSEDEQMIFLPPEAYSYNVEQLVYEMIYAAVPMRKVHGDFPGQQCDQQMLDLLEAHQKSNGNTTCDPRWEALKDLKL